MSTMAQQGATGRILMVAALTALILCLFVSRSLAEASRIDGWVLEPGVDMPSYAVTAPASTNLNIDTVLLVCEEGAGSRVIQLKLYLSGTGPLLPRGYAESALKRYPTVEAVIDQRAYPARLYFSDEYVMVADTERERFPVLSEFLLDAMAKGRTMVLRFDLTTGRHAHDGEAVIELQAGRGGQAINAVRRCAADEVTVGVARAGD